MNRTMKQWKHLAFFDADHWMTLYGDGNAELCPWHMKDEIVGYTLELIGMNLPSVPESQYQKSQHYFYERVHADPDIYRYVSQSIGGDINFRGRGRWSGSAFDLGVDLGFDLEDVFIDGSAGYAMKVEDVTRIVSNQFPGLKFELIEKEYMFDLIVNYKEVK